MSIKNPAETDIIPNPLHRYASYTYSWSLWWLDITDYERLMDSVSATDAMNFKPVSKNSFVVAQDGGRHPDRRQPGTLGLNYHIQNVQFTSLIGPNRTSKSSNMISGSMTILEPYGVTLIDTLIAASWDGTTYNNYTDNPYMLELEFRGYDDNGEEIPRTENDLVIYNKRFPISVLDMKLEVTTRGTEYKINFVPTGSTAFQSVEYRTTPEQINITAGTVQEFFDKLAEDIQKYYQSLVIKNHATVADGIFFKIDPEIANSKIVNESKISLSRANPEVNNIQLDKSNFTIPKGTPILDIITKVLAHSDFLIQKQLGLEVTANENTNNISQTDIFKAIKTTTKVEYGGIDLNGQRQAPAIDVRSNRYPKTITYNIHQYAIWSAKHPAAPLYTDSNPYTQKYYNYMYTGLNTDIVDLKINFDSTYYTAILAFNEARAIEESTPDTDIETLKYQASFFKNPVSLNPAIFSKIYPQLAQVPTITPLQYKFIPNDLEITGGMNIIDRPAARVAADVLKSIYTAQNQEMLSLQLTIVGDPTLIKQDDWLYVPDPDEASDFNDWDISSYDYALKYGHIPMDRGEVAVHVNINSPVDMDIDQEGGNQGLAFPQPKYSQSLFSGQYTIIKIDNKFANGKFEQVLSLARIMGDEVVSAFNQSSNDGSRRDRDTGPVEIGYNNDIELSQTNPNKPIGDQYDPDNVSNEPLPIDTSIPPGTTLIINPESSAPWTVEVNADPRQ